MSRLLAPVAVLLLAVSATADDKDWTGRSVRLKEGVKLGRKLAGGLVRDGAPLDKGKTYVVKSDDGTFLELTGETGFVFKIDVEVVPAAKADPGSVDARRAALLKAGYTAVPLTYDPKNMSFYTDGAVAAEKAEKVKFFVDSGVRETVIDLKVAKALKLELGKESVSQGIGGKWAGRATEYSHLRIGPYDTGKDWRGLSAEAGDLSGWTGSPGAVIGMEVLEPWGAVIDYHARTMYLRPPLVSAWPRLAGTWSATSWQEQGAARKLDPKAPPTFTFTDQRLKVTDGGTTREYDITFGPNDEGDFLILHRFGRAKPEQPSGVGRVRIKDGTMTACVRLLDKPDAELTPPTEFAAPRGSGLVLMEFVRAK